VGAVVDKPGYVILRHLRQLLLEDAFEAGKNDKAIMVAIIVDDPELDVAVSFFDYGGL